MYEPRIVTVGKPQEPADIPAWLNAQPLRQKIVLCCELFRLILNEANVAQADIQADEGSPISER